MPMFPPEVHRSHLTPLRFLQRSASVFREKPAVVYGERRGPTRSWRSGSTVWPPRCARRCRAGRPRRLPAAEHPADAGGALRACRWPAAILVAINTGSRRRRDRLHPRPLRRQSPDRRHRAGASGRAVAGEPSRPRARSSASTTSPAASSLPGPDYEAFLAGGSPDPLDWPLDDEDETIAINYTSGTTGRPKGVMYTHRGAYLNALGELLETRMIVRQRLPLDAADVPLQRLVLPLGRDRHRRHPRLPAQGRPGRRSGG